MADSLIIKIDGDASGYQKELNKMKAGVEEVNKIAKGVVLGVSAVGGAVIGMGVKFNAQMEQYKAGLTTLLGDTQKATNMLSELKSFASKTPFELGDLASATNVLLSFGESSELIMDDLKMLGDISLGNKEKFQGLALVFGQVQSQGKLMGQDLLQMINNGFNPLQIISEKTGESMSSLKDKMSKGQISFEMIADAMKTATSEGGKFYNAMETQSKTFEGQVSTLKDNVNALFGAMTTDISEALSEDVLPWLIEQVDKLNQAWESGELQKHIKGAAVALAAFGAAVLGLNLIMFVNDIYSIVKGVQGFTAATKAGTTAQKLFNAELLKNPYTLAAMALAALVAGMVTYAATHKSASQEIIDSIKDIKKSHEDAIKAAEASIATSSAEAEVAKTLQESLFDLDAQLKSGTLTQEEAELAQEKFKVAGDELNKLIPGITDKLYDETGAIDVQYDSVKDLTDSYYDLAVAKATAAAYEEKIKATASSLIDAKQKQKEAKRNFEENTGMSYDEWAAWITAQENGTPLPESQRPTGHATGASIQTVKETVALVNELTEKQNSYKEDYLELMATIPKETEESGKKVDRVVTGTTGSAVKSAEDASKKLEELRENELDDIKFMHDTGEMSDREYYKTLAVYRDKYFEVGSKEWKDFTKEIYKYQQDLTEDSIELIESMQEEAQEAVENLKKTRQEISNTLKETKRDTYYTVTFPFGEIQQSMSKLADVGADNKNLEKYNQMLDDLFAREENLPDFVLTKLAGMNLTEGMDYVSALLRASDKEFDEYISNLNEQDKYTGLIADKLTKSETERLRENIENVFGMLPEDFFDIGSESSEQFTEGFIEMIKSKMAEAKQVIESSLANIALNIQVQADSRAGVVNNYSSTYTIQPSGTSTTEQLAAIRDAETFERMRGTK